MTSLQGKSIQKNIFYSSPRFFIIYDPTVSLAGLESWKIYIQLHWPLLPRCRLPKRMGVYKFSSYQFYETDAFL